MKRALHLSNAFCVQAKKVQIPYSQQLNYFLIYPSGETVYLCTKPFSASCYSLCKTKVPVNKVLYDYSRNKATSKLRKQLFRLVSQQLSSNNLGQEGRVA